MLRRSLLLRQKNQQNEVRRGWKGKILDGLSKTINKYVPDPRRDPMAERPVGYEDFKSDKHAHFTPDYNEGETLEDYMRQRNERWVKKNMGDNLPPTKEMREERGFHDRPDGGIFIQTGSKELDVNVDAQNIKMKEILSQSAEVDEEKMKLRRQLQVENAEEYRKFVSEMKRSELQEQQSMRRRMPHPADPKYDPFKNTPGYRPQDSTKLASWLNLVSVLVAQISLLVKVKNVSTMKKRWLLNTTPIPSRTTLKFPEVSPR